MRAAQPEQANQTLLEATMREALCHDRHSKDGNLPVTALWLLYCGAESWAQPDSAPAGAPACYMVPKPATAHPSGAHVLATRKGGCQSCQRSRNGVENSC